MDIEFEENTDEDFNDEFDSDTDNSSTQMSDMIGKTVSDIFNEGYEFSGHSSIDNDYSFYVTSYEAPSDILDIIQQLEGLTVKDLLDKDLNIGYMIMMDQCILTAQIGSSQISFEVEGAAEIINSYKDEDPFTDIEDMPELYDLPVTNVTFDHIKYTMVLDEDFITLAASDDFTLDSPEEQLKDFTVTDFYCEPIPDIF